MTLPDVGTVAPLIAEFERWMREHRGVRASTLRSYRYPLGRLLRALGQQPARFAAADVRRFICGQASLHGHSYARMAVTATRVFLRFLSASGRCAPTLADAVPVVAGWKLAELPRYLRPEVVERALALCDGAKASGLRDRALILLSARLGLRAGDMHALLLEDLDFRLAVVRVAGKGRRQSALPLPQDVGDALLTYLERGRPPCVSRHVFVRSRAPFGPHKDCGSFSKFIHRALARAGACLRPCGAHALRHSAAFRLLQEGASLETIGALLRHSSIATTGIYAKVDVSALSEVAQSWPDGVRPC
jgi:integrase/recombinase XerD